MKPLINGANGARKLRKMKAVADQHKWVTRSLRDMATINYGRSPAEILSDDGPYPVVGTGGGERLGNDYLYEGESIILGRKGTIDRVYFATGRFWTIDTAYYLSEFGNTVPRWLFYYLQSLDLRQMNEATGVPSLSRDLLYKIKIPTPPKPEQARIAEILSTVDRAIEQTEALIAKQQRIKTGLMQDLLTRGIDEHGNLRSEQTHKFKDSPLGRIPAEWQVTTFGEVLRKYGGLLQTGPFGSQLHSYEYEADGVPVVMPQDIASNGISTDNIARITENKAESLRRHRMVPGDLCFARRGDLSRCAVVGEKERGWLCGTGCLLMRPPAKVLSPRWTADTYRFHPCQLQVAARAVGSTMPNLNVGILSYIKIALPSNAEQIRIETQLQAIDYDDVKVMNQLAKLGFFKTALMQDLLTGRVRLLEKIE